MFDVAASIDAGISNFFSVHSGACEMFINKNAHAEMKTKFGIAIRLNPKLRCSIPMG